MQSGVAVRVAAMGAFYTLVLPAIYALRYPSVAPAYLFVGDAFYYLDIARHAVAGQGFSFDGQFVTNGFHPLWEWVLVALGRMGVVRFGSPAASLLADFWVDALVLCAAAGLLAGFATRLLRRPTLALLVVAPGLLWFATGLINTQFLATWSYLNGMESALALMFFALALWVSGAEMSGKRGLWFTSLLGLAILARLDDALVAVPMLLAMPVRGMRRRVLASLPMLGMLLAYVVYNKVTVGAMLPLSGAAKASFALNYNAKWMAALFLPVVTGDGPSALFAGPHAYYGFGERAARMAQMATPALVCAVELWMLRRRGFPREMWVMAGAAAGVCLKALYNFLFVIAWAQGQWYYAVSVAVANVILVCWMDRALMRLAPRPVEGRWRLVGLVTHALLVLLSFNLFISRRNADGPVSEVMLLRDPSPLKRELSRLGADRFIEYDDGFTSFVAERPALAGLGLALDASAARALREGRFFDLAYRRGYRVLVANGIYTDIVEGATRNVSGTADLRFAFLLPRELANYRLESLGGDGSEDGLRYYGLLPR